jgi:hypothetical protein
MSKKQAELLAQEAEAIDVTAEDVTEGVMEYVPDASEAVIVRASMGELVDTNESGRKLLVPQFINASKDTGDARIGKEKFELLKCGQVAEAIILKIDGLGYLKANPENVMAPPIKYGSRAEAEAAGEIIDWPPKGVAGPKPTVAPFRDFSLLVKSPGEPNPAFNVELPDGSYAPGIYSVGRTAYYQNCPQDEGILKVIRFEMSQGRKMYQLVWNVQAVLHRYASGYTSGYLKFTFTKRLKEDDPRFVAIDEAISNI